MNFELILEETKKTYQSEKHNMPIDSLDPYYELMDLHYEKINKYIGDTIKDKKGAEKGELLGNMNKILKSKIDDKDLMIFILEHLSSEYSYIDEF